MLLSTIFRRTPITFDQLRKQVDKKGLRKYDCIIVLGGRRYVDLLEKAFIGKKIVNPLEGCSGNGGDDEACYYKQFNSIDL